MASRYLLVVTVLAAMAGACGRTAHKAPETEAIVLSEPASGSNEVAVEPAAPDAANTGMADPVPATQKVIKTGRLRFSVSDFTRGRERILQQVAKYGAYIGGENEHRSELEWRNEMVIKVPADRFSACLDALAAGAGTLEEKSISAQDVTEAYVDIAARMKAKKEVEQRYLQILQQAKSVKEILEVEGQLKGIREEIEAAQGRLQYIDHHAALSTINLTYYQTVANTQPLGHGFFSRVGRSLQDGWNLLLALCIGLLSWWPLWLGAGVMLIAVRRYRKRRLAVKPLKAS